MATRKTKAPVPQSTGPFGLPVDFAPMESVAKTDLPAGEDWWYEPKWDGFRCLVFKEGDQVDLRAKSGKPLARYFPEVVAFIAQLSAPRFVIDGELVIDVDGHLDFEALQLRLHPAESRVRKLAAQTPARIILFDMLLTTDGEHLVEAPLSKRRKALETFVAKMKTSHLSLSPGTRDRDEALAWLSQAGVGATDGVVAKQWSQAYQSGERAMVKVKRLRTADCVVGGFRYASNAREVGSLLLGLYNDAGKLDHIGYTTITDAERPALTKRLEKLRKPPGFTGDAPGGPSRWSTERSAQWEPLKPELVVEVRYDHVSGGRFRHGAKLMRWRPDKAPAQCTYEQIAPLRKS